MTHPDHGRDVGLLLNALVPELPVPPDRLAAVERRIRRRRVRLAVLAAACVALVLIGVPVLIARGPGHPLDPPGGPRRPDAGNCLALIPPSPEDNGSSPAVAIAPPVVPFPEDSGSPPATAPGALVPVGAVRAIRCQYDPLPEWRRTGPGPARELVLTRDVAGLVATLNSLPVEPQLDPCFGGGASGYVTLVYENGATATVDFDECDIARRGGVIRHDNSAAVQAFDERFRQQELAAAARPDAVPPAHCAPRLQSAFGDEPDRFFTPNAVTDTWLHTYGEHLRYLPAPAAVVTACRYVRDRHGHFGRTRQVEERRQAGQVADALETAFKTRAVELPFSDCTTGTAVRTVDALIVRDVVGETAEVRIVRDTCDVVTFGFNGATPNAALLTILNRLLGRPR